METEKYNITIKWPGDLNLASNKKYYIKNEWDKSVLGFFAVAVKFLNVEFQLTENQNEIGNNEVRDDNGNYYWDGNYKIGNSECFVKVTYHGKRGEDLMYPTPMEETRTYMVFGLKENKVFEITLNYREFAAELSWIKLTMSIDCQLNDFNELKKIFFNWFTNKSNQ